MTSERAGGRLLVFLGAGVVAAALSSVAVNQYADHFEIPARVIPQDEADHQTRVKDLLDAGEITGNEAMGMSFLGSNIDEIKAERIAATEQTEYRNSALSYALVGLLVATSLGLAAGVVKKSVAATLCGLLLGIVLGTGLGAAGGITATFAEGVLNRGDPMLLTIAMHAAGWIVVALGVALPVGLATRASWIPKFMLAAVISGVLAAVLFSIGAGFLFPSEMADRPVPEGTGNRILWTALFAVATAFFLGRTATSVAVSE